MPLGHNIREDFDKVFYDKKRTVSIICRLDKTVIFTISLLHNAYNNRLLLRKYYVMSIVLITM